MADKQNQIVTILVKYALKQELSEEEQRMLAEWRSRSGAHGELPDQLRDPEWREEHRRETEQAPSAEMWENIRLHIRESKAGQPEAVRDGQRWLHWKRWVAAASVAILLSSLAWLYSAQKKDVAAQFVKKAPLVAALQPPVNGGVGIRLSDGRVVDPGGFRQGAVITRDGGVVITRTANGFDYSLDKNSVLNPAITNMIVTGRNLSQPLQVGLADGSRVWLDTSTRFAYPLELRIGPEPVLEGQAFFAMAHHDPAHPLRLWTGKGESLTVLGTSFGVRSYAAEPQGKVELYTGQLRVDRKEESLLLNPSLMALITEERGLELQTMGPHEEIPEWMRPPARSPYFEFQNTPLSVALNEVAGWYRKSVANPDTAAGIPVTGKLPHSQSLENTLRALERVQGGNAFLRAKADTIFVTTVDPGP